MHDETLIEKSRAATCRYLAICVDITAELLPAVAIFSLAMFAEEGSPHQVTSLLLLAGVALTTGTVLAYALLVWVMQYQRVCLDGHRLINVIVPHLLVQRVNLLDILALEKRHCRMRVTLTSGSVRYLLLPDHHPQLMNKIMQQRSALLRTTTNKGNAPC